MQLLKYKHIKQYVMKLRTLFWIGISALTLFACEEPDNTIKTTTKLEFIIPVNSMQVQTNGSTDFSGFAIFCLDNKDNVQNCPSNILSVIPDKGSVLNMTNLGGEINKLELDWGYGTIESGEFDMQSTTALLSKEEMIGMRDINVDLDDTLRSLINKIDSNPKNYIKVMIKGNANFKVYSSVKVEIPIVIDHEVLEVRFTI